MTEAIPNLVLKVWPVIGGQTFSTIEKRLPPRMAPANGRKLLASTEQGPRTFFEPWWARDFITMSARPARSGTG
jgi:hypothetical protein